MSVYFTYESALIRLGFSAFSSVFDGFSVFIVNFRSTWMNSSCRVTYRWNGSKNDEFGVKMKKMKIWRLVRKTSRRDLRNQHTSRRDVKVSRRDPRIFTNTKVPGASRGTPRCDLAPRRYEEGSLAPRGWMARRETTNPDENKVEF